ncbi:MAG TPA: DUF4190 domain-containing protein [Nocardioides sp.]|nr:DUF4190 domain-containing protein [Nocardioides sp.]
MSDQQPPPYGQQPPGQPNPYQPQGYSPYGGAPGQPPFIAPDHPQASTVLILGILGLAVCQVLGPFAWVMGNRTVREIDASGGRMGGRSQANIGRVLGIVASALLILSVLALVVYVIALVVFVGSST